MSKIKTFFKRLSRQNTRQRHSEVKAIYQLKKLFHHFDQKLDDFEYHHKLFFNDIDDIRFLNIKIISKLNTLTRKIEGTNNE